MTAPTCARPGCGGPREYDGFCEPDFRRRLRSGRGGLRDGAQAVAHLRLLRDTYGWTWQQIADEMGTGITVAHQLHTGKVKRVRERTEAAILAIPPGPAGESLRGIPAAGTRRRVQSLAWMGWPGRTVAEMAGYDRRALELSYRHRVSVRLASRVAALYDELAGRPGPSPYIAREARKCGHAPPAAWDGIDMDDPKARPRGVRREAA